MGGDGLQIEYANERIEKILTDGSKLIQRCGLPMAKQIKSRLDSLEASDTWEIYLQTNLGKPHSLNIPNGYYIGISLSANYRLIIRLCCDEVDATSIKQCEIIEVKGVEDYHGQKTNWIIK